MKNTKFEVDLGTLQLSAAQNGAISAAIQQAVVGELAKLELKKKIVIMPVNFPGRRGELAGLKVRLMTARLEQEFGL
ncbi:MAG: hypothetical protein KA352_14015 [Flavobacteriales bacterium]|nr:hypothetical protein [Flavobacteriales bacterium]